MSTLTFSEQKKKFIEDCYFEFEKEVYLQPSPDGKWGNGKKIAWSHFGPTKHTSPCEAGNFFIQKRF